HHDAILGPRRVWTRGGAIDWPGIWDRDRQVERNGSVLLAVVGRDLCETLCLELVTTCRLVLARRVGARIRRRPDHRSLDRERLLANTSDPALDVDLV